MKAGQRPLAPGKQAPEFTARTQFGETLELSALAGTPVLVMFYPFAFSRVCGSELAQLHARWDEVAATGTETLAVSCDAIHTLRAFSTELGDPQFQLVSDFWPHGEIAQAYGAFDPVKGCPTRTSFLLDAQHTVRQVIAAETTEPRDLDLVLQGLRSLA